MASDLISRLPSELWDLVVDNLPSLSDLMMFSSINSSSRSLFASRLFRCFKLSNKIKNLEAMPQFLKRHRHLIHEIHYDCNLQPGRRRDSGVLTMPGIVKDILATRRLPNVQIVRLAFDPKGDFGDASHNLTGFNQFGRWTAQNYLTYIQVYPDKDLPEVLHQWRADVMAVFSAIMKNKKHLQHLEIKNLMPQHCIAWRKSQKWIKFLARVDRLSLDIWRSSRGRWPMSSNTYTEYGKFVRNLQPNFFQHLNKVTHLHLAIQVWNILGGEGPHHSLLPIANQDLPSLTDLTLENFFLDPSLLNLLYHRRDHIQSIELISCWAVSIENGPSSATNAVSWSRFFKEVREMQPRNLIALTIYFTMKVEKIEERFRSYWRYGDPFDRAMKKIDANRENLKNMDAPLFPYGFLTAGGYIRTSEHGSRKAFEAGEDRAEFDLLMELVEENRRQRLAGDMTV